MSCEEHSRETRGGGTGEWLQFPRINGEGAVRARCHLKDLSPCANHQAGTSFKANLLNFYKPKSTRRAAWQT